MNLFEAVANWYGCPYGLKKCRQDCENFIMIDPRSESEKSVGQSTNGRRYLCRLLEDVNQQVMKKTKDPRLIL